MKIQHTPDGSVRGGQLTEMITHAMGDHQIVIIHERPWGSSQNRSGFTLVELLVVVSVIAILVSLLIPAVEQAMYQAQLSACAANMKTVATAATVYAADHQQHYPKRHKNYSWDGLWLRLPPSYDSRWPFDLRAQFAPYMSVKSFLDPMLGGVSLDDAANRPECNIYGNYVIYTGLSLAGAPSMDKVGQRFEATDDMSPGRPQTYEFNVIAADRNMYWNDRWSASSHSDRGVLRNGALQDFEAGAGYYVTISYWAADGGDHNPAELNYAYVDGSVAGYGAVTKLDERMARIVVTNIDDYNTGRFDHLPRQ